MASLTVHRRVLVVALFLKVRNESLKDPLDFTSGEKNSQRLSLLIDRVREVISSSYTRKLNYGALSEMGGSHRKITIYFPTIVIDNDPIYRVLINMIAKALNDAQLFNDENECYGRVKWSEANVSFEEDPEPVEDFAEALRFNCDSISQGHLNAQQCCHLTTHTIALSVDRFSLLLEYYHNIHKYDQLFFYQHIRYIVGAYHHQRKLTTYAERERNHVTSGEWESIAAKFGVDKAVAARYYKQVEDYAYTTVTMEEILKRHNKEIADKLESHQNDKLRHMIAELILQNETPSHNKLWEVFAEFIRMDHFYADKKIWVLDEVKCIERGPNELRPVVNRFINYIKEGVMFVQADPGCEKKQQDISDRIRDMCKPFENSSSCRFIESACSNYLFTRFRTAIRQSAIPFSDVVLVFDQNKLYERKAFMEDQFTSTVPVSVLGFGKSDKDKTAIKDVREALRKMFRHKDNIDFFIRWCGSLLAHRPERTCLIMYGPKGGNAKTTIFKVLCSIFGEYATQCRPDILIANTKGGQTCTPFEMDLMNKVLAVVSEPQKSQIYSSSTLKDMTGGDLKKAAAKYKDPVTFEQTAKPVILSNHMIQFDEVDTPLCDRLYILHCYGRFTNIANPDKTIQETEHHYPVDEDFWNDERKQALAYLLIYEGFPQYIEKGLIKTKYMLDELNKWKSDNNAFTAFCISCKQIHNGKRWQTEAKNVYSVFKEKHQRQYSNLSYDSFISQFVASTGLQIKNLLGEDYFDFYHPQCVEREEVQN